MAPSAPRMISNSGTCAGSAGARTDPTNPPTPAAGTTTALAAAPAPTADTTASRESPDQRSVRGEGVGEEGVATHAVNSGQDEQPEREGMGCGGSRRGSTVGGRRR